MAYDESKSFSLPDGLILNENDGGASVFSGSASPIGIDLPIGALYLQKTVTGSNLWRKFGATTSEWRQLSAQDIPFVNTGTTFRNSDTRSALLELRDQVVRVPQFITTSLNGNTNLDTTSKTLIIIDGTATGHSIILPNATTLFQGQIYEIFNVSSQSVVIKRFDGTTITTIIAGDTANATLRNNSTSAGLWNVTAITSVAAGVSAFNVTQTTLFSTTSSSDVLITGFSNTPPSGTYGVWFNSNAVIGSNKRVAQSVIFKDGTAVADTRRTQQGIGSNYRCTLSTLGIIQVNGSQAIDVRVNINAGSLSLKGRSLLLIRLGA